MTATLPVGLNVALTCELPTLPHRQLTMLPIRRRRL
jgi:hypothetical protein